MKSDDTEEKHVIVSADVHRRLKLFSAKYGIPMKFVLEWFITTLLDENGDPDLDELKEAVDIIMHNEYFLNLLKEYKLKNLRNKR